jgi:chemotaxis protein histidine kinase CheA
MSKPSTQIIVSFAPDGSDITIPPDVYKLKNQALSKAQGFHVIKTQADQEKVAAVIAELKGLSRAMEKTRKLVKQPYLETGDLIDEKAKDFQASLDTRAAELERMVAAWIQQERERVRIEQEAQERERRRLADEAAAEQRRLEAAQRAAQEAERRAAEAELAAAEAEGKKAKAAAAKALAEAQAAQAAAQEAAQEAEEAASIAAAETVTEVEVKLPESTGGRVREKVEFTVIDIEALYHWDLERRQLGREKGRDIPSFIKLEVKIRDFDQYINILSDSERAEIPGVKFANSSKFHSNITKPQLAIQ